MKYLPSLALLLLFLGLSAGSFRLWDTQGLFIVPAGRYPVALGLLLILAYAGRCLYLRKLPTLEELAEPRIWTAGLLLLFFTDLMCRTFVFFQAPPIRGELLLGAALTYAICRYGAWKRITFLPIASALLLAWSFTLVSRGGLLFSDDHAMFQFRLQLLKENFPGIPFWCPLWNAGIDARDFFATGALNAFFLAMPLVYSFDISQVYNLIVILLLWVLVPGSTYLAARLLGAERPVSAIAAVLSMCTGLVWYKWTLKYGTMGFATSASLLPLVIALGTRFLTSQHLSRGLVIGTVLATTLMLLWSPSGIAIAPLGIIALRFTGSIVRSKRHVLTMVLIIALNVPWMFALWKVSSVGKFLSSHKQATVTSQEQRATFEDAATSPSAKVDQVKPSAYRHRAAGLNLRRSLELWQENFSSMNPLILLLAIPAILLLPAFQRLIFGSLALWMLLVGTVAVPLVPQLELDRMLVLMSVVLCYPVANCIAVLFRDAGRTWGHRLAACTAGAYLFVSPFAASGVVLNRSWEQYSIMDPEVRSLTEVLRTEASSGRVLFSGCVLHQLSGGHLAPLALWADTPMVASSYAHNIWRYEQVIPKSYLARGDTGIREYFDHMNATVVLAHEPYWREYFAARPDQYREIWHAIGFIAFKRLTYTPSYVLQGQADGFDHTTSSVTLVPRTPRVVLKFRYFPFLEASGCAVKSFPAAPDLELVELADCTPGAPVTMRSLPALRRILNAAASR